MSNGNFKKDFPKKPQNKKQKGKKEVELTQIKKGNTLRRIQKVKIPRIYTIEGNSISIRFIYNFLLLLESST